MRNALRNNNSFYKFFKRRKDRLFVALVWKAYHNRMGSAHKLIRAAGRVWYGLSPKNLFLRIVCHWFMDSVFIAQKSIYRSNKEGIELGLEEIGVDKLKIHCSSENINSSIVYLAGFCDNLFHFKIYEIFASPGTVAIDVGANLGIHSLVLSRCVGENGKVYSFEPVPELIDKLNANLVLNKIKNAVILEKGAGDSVGQKPFKFNKKDFNIGKGCVDLYSKNFFEFSTIDHEVGSNHRKISLIKIDTEGYELNVLKGAIKCITGNRPVLVVEFNPSFYKFEDMKKYMPANYAFFKIPEFYHLKIARITGDNRDRGDILMIPDEKDTTGMLSLLNKTY